MAFFSDARDLTRSLTESTKLRAWVKEEERQTQENLLELGKQYYALHRDDPEAPLRDLVNTLADSEIRVAQYWELIKEYECLVICEHCGTEMTQGTAVCVECGRPLPVPMPKNVFCARCGAQIVPGSRFCMNCGTPAPEFQPVSHQRFCVGCGAVLEECVDNDKDHACDNGCDVYQGVHADSDGDEDTDHLCAGPACGLYRVCRCGPLPQAC